MATTSISRRTFFLACSGPLLQGQNEGPKMFGNAESYERFMGRWSRLVAPLLVQFAAVSEAGQVLDIGSGTGSLAFEVARRKRGTRVTGIDPSEEYVAYAMSKRQFPERTTFEVGDAQRLRFANGTFDACVSLLVFNFIPDPAQALREVRRVTKPGARISAAVWDYGGRMEMLRAFWEATVSLDPQVNKGDEQYMKLSRSGDLAQLWKQGGLENVREQPLDISMKFASFRDYWDPFLLGQGPAGTYVRSLDEKQVQALRDTVKQRLAVTEESQALTLPARVWAVRGTVPR
ncbi:MAG: class I SAM-dependent methyltransferase [Bryobacteraceae bacterium]|nr:class I SAM-dependent methyltransferase [Bryobacteraceae bacterium]